MEIITSFTALNLEPGNLPKEALQLRQGDFQSVLKALQDAYCNTASDPDAYLYETVAPENIIFGLYEPEKVLSVWMHGTAKSESNFCGRSKTCVPV